MDDQTIARQARAMTPAQARSYLRDRSWTGAGNEWRHPTFGSATLPAHVVASYSLKGALLTAMHEEQGEIWSKADHAWIPRPPA